MVKAKLYATLYNAYVVAYPKKSKQVCQQEFNVKWTELKKGEGLEDKVVVFLRELKSVELKNKGSSVDLRTVAIFSGASISFRFVVIVTNCIPYFISTVRIFRPRIIYIYC